MSKKIDVAPIRYWLVPVEGFDPMVAVAPTAAKARHAVFSAGKDAGYFDGPDGFRRFLAASSTPQSIGLEEAKRRIGGHRPIGAGR